MSMGSGGGYGWTGRRRWRFTWTNGGHQRNMLMCIVVIVVTITSSAAAATDAGSSGADLTAVDICRGDGNAGVQCGSGDVVHVRKLGCGRDGTQKCDRGIRDHFLRLCEGRKSCASLGLKEVFGKYCRSSPPRQRLLVSYMCRQAPVPAPACRANLCSSVTRSLSCPALSVLHIRNVTCHDGQVTCSPATFLTLYSLCEGRQECDASGLRMLTPLSMYCEEEKTSAESRNVFVDFLCVSEDLVHNRCGAHYTNLKQQFGVLMNPGFVGGSSPTSSSMLCNWFLSPDDETTEVRIMVHMAYSKWNDQNCTNTLFLQIHYKSCENQEQKTSNTRNFCDLSHINSPVTACGTVNVVSWKPVASGDNHGFLVSYQMVPKNGTRNPGEFGAPEGIAECSTHMETPAPTLISVTTRPTVARRNYGPGRTMFDYSDTIRHTAVDSDSSDKTADGTFQFKLIILYVFFGVVILALLIALVYVLVSYRGISRRGRHGSENSEKTALWRHDDTPLDTFNHNSHLSLADVANCNLYTPSPELRHPTRADVSAKSEDARVVACTVHAESTTDDEEDNRLSTGSAFSSFLSGKDMDLQDLLDSFNPYDTLTGIGSPGKGNEGEGGEAEGGGGTRSSSFMTNSEQGNIYEAIDNQQFGNQPQGCWNNHEEDNHEDKGRVTPLQQKTGPSLSSPKESDYPSPVEHYTINNDDYALVKKPKSNPLICRVSPAPDNIYTNLPCIQQEEGISPEDPAYDTVGTFRNTPEPVVGFRNTSGHYDGDLNLNGGPVSPS